MNVVEKLLGVKPTSVLAQGNTNLSKAMYITAKKYSLIASVNKIKKNRKNFCPLSFWKVSNNVYKLLNDNKAMTVDLIPP